MPQNTTLTIKDGKVTPADHVFSPVRITADNLAIFAERSSGSKIGEPTLSFQVRQPNKDSAAYKVALQVNMPKVVSVTDAQGRVRDVVEYTAIGKAELVFAPQMTKEARNDVLMLLANGLVNGTLKTAIGDLESFW